MKDPKRREQLAAIVERRRRDLGDREGISERVQKLSESSNRNRVVGPTAKRPSLVTILVATAAVAVMLVCGATAAVGIAGGFWFRGQLDDPSQTALNFYSALHQQDYSRAYSYFSSASRVGLSEAAFTERFRAYDQVGGIVQSYTVVGTSAISGSTATVKVNVVRRGNSDQAQQQVVYLVKDGNDWRIDRITLGGSVPVPTPKG